MSRLIVVSNRVTPPVNDSGRNDVRSRLREGYATFTNRLDFLWLATGGTLVTATHYLAERGAKDVTAINIIAAPEGIQYVQDHIDPSIAFKVVVCAVDEKLNEKAYIVPGLGDAGDRLYGVID